MPVNWPEWAIIGTIALLLTMDALRPRKGPKNRNTRDLTFNDFLAESGCAQCYFCGAYDVGLRPMVVGDRVLELLCEECHAKAT